MTAVDTELDQLRASGGDPEFYRLKAYSGGQMAFRGQHVVMGRMSPKAAGIENQIHLFVTERETVVIGLRVGHPEGGPNGPIQESGYQILREFEELGSAMAWLDATCPWTEAVGDMKRRLEQEHR